jgi:hypothetical protein
MVVVVAAVAVVTVLVVATAPVMATTVLVVATALVVATVVAGTLEPASACRLLSLPLSLRK